MAASLTDISEQASNIDNPLRISRRAVKRAIACTITGNAISGSASAMELAQNTWVMLRADKSGYSPKDSLATVKSLIVDINKHLHSREQLSAMELDPRIRRVKEIETMLMRRILLQLLSEFKVWSCHSRERAWRENTFFTIDSLQSYLRMTASIIARQALKEPDLAGGAIICATVSNSLATLNPILANLIGITMRKHQEKKMNSELNSELSSDAISDTYSELPLIIKELESAESGEVSGKDSGKDSGKASEGILEQYYFLSERSRKLDSSLNREARDIERFRKIAQQQSIAGPLIGLTGLSSSILSATAFYGHRSDLITANKLGLSGRISQTVGQSAALIITPYTTIRGALRNRRLSKNGELPAQILEERLRKLDQLEAKVLSTKVDL